MGKLLEAIESANFLLKPQKEAIKKLLAPFLLHSTNAEFIEKEFDLETISATDLLDQFLFEFMNIRLTDLDTLERFRIRNFLNQLFDQNERMLIEKGGIK